MLGSRANVYIPICWGILRRLPFVPPTKKKVDLFFSNSFPIIYRSTFISYIYITVSINGLDHNKHRQTFSNKPLPGIELGSRRLQSAALPLHHARRAESSWSHTDNIKNSAISVVAGAIYMRSLTSSRCYI